MKITRDKDYHLVYTNFIIYLQTLRYSDNDNRVYFIDSYKTLINKYFTAKKYNKELDISSFTNY